LVTTRRRRRMMTGLQVKDNGLCPCFLYTRLKNDHFIKTGSGQT
jgi:hypothetical protein